MARENRARDSTDLPLDPELADVLRMVARSIKLDIRTHVPAKVVSYNPATQTAIVEVGILSVVKVTDPTRLPERILKIDGVPPNANATLQPLVLVDIPVAWPRTAMGYLTFPLAVGDTGELHVHDRSIEQWKLLGIATDPVLAFTHALKDSVFHPGLHPVTSPITPATDATATVLDGTSAIKIGRLAIAPIAKADLVAAQLDALKTAITGWVPVAMDGGAALKVALTAWLASSSVVAATKGKVE